MLKVDVPALPTNVRSDVNNLGKIVRNFLVCSRARPDILADNIERN